MEKICNYILISKLKTNFKKQEKDSTLIVLSLDKFLTLYPLCYQYLDTSLKFILMLNIFQHQGPCHLFHSNYPVHHIGKFAINMLLLSIWDGL